MSETIRRTRAALLMIEMVMMLGVPAPRLLASIRQRFDTWRWERRRTRSLPQRTRGYERLVRLNPGLLPSPTMRRITAR